MLSQHDEYLKTYHGSFETIQLDFIAEPSGPILHRRKTRANYPVALAYFHCYLNNEDATKLLPSAYLCPLLEGLLKAIPLLLQGIEASATWYSDPWKFELRANPNNNRVFITLRVPNRWIAMQDVSVSLKAFGQQIIQLGRNWLDYLTNNYHDEVIDPELGKQYRQLEFYLEIAEQSLSEYKPS